MAIERSAEDRPRRGWSPYRKDELVVDLPDEVEEWDPVMKDQYLSNLEEAPPADTLVLEARRSALESARTAVDVGRRAADGGSPRE